MAACSVVSLTASFCATTPVAGKYPWIAADPDILVYLVDLTVPSVKGEPEPVFRFGPSRDCFSGVTSPPPSSSPSFWW